VKSLSDRSDKEATGQKKGNLEKMKQMLRDMGAKEILPPKGIKIRFYPNPKVPPKPKTSEKDSTND
jgi:hypothetical protein